MKSTNKDLLIFCHNIRALRRVHKLTQKEMAKICGISISTLRKLEHNILPVKISIRTVFNLSIYFNLLPSQLFTLGAETISRTDA